MAGLLKDKNRLLQTIQGMGSLVAGSPTDISRYAAMDIDALEIILRQQINLIDTNVRPPQSIIGRWLNGSSLLQSEGAKANLQDTLRRAIGNETLEAQEQSALEAALEAAGYDNVVFDNQLSAGERSHFNDFAQRLNEGFSLSSIFDNNAQARTQSQLEQERLLREENIMAQEQARRAASAASQAAEQAAEQARNAQELDDFNNQLSAKLVFAGYLKPEEAGNEEAANKAISRLINDTTNHSLRNAEYGKAVIGGQPTAYAMEVIEANIQGIMPYDGNGNDRVKAFLESGDPAQVKLAQGYLGLSGTGEINAETAQAGLDAIRKPLEMPAALTASDGSLNLQSLHNMAAAGQLYLPIEALSAKQQEAAMAFPKASEMRQGDFMSREQFIAVELIAKDPDGYQALLDKENARRADTGLNVSFEHEKLELASDTAPAETNRAANNPMGLKALAQDENYTPEARAPLLAADAVTSNDHTLAFSDMDKGLSTFLGQLDNSKGGVTMQESIIQYQIEAGLGDYSTNNRELRQAGLVTEALGYEKDHRFDLSNPVETEALLKGTVSFAMARQETLDIKDGENYIEALENNHQEIAESIGRVSRGAGAGPENAVPAGTGPGLTEEMLISSAGQHGYLTQGFNVAHDNLPLPPEAMPEAGPGEDLIANNINRRPDHAGIGLG
ncbi:MAG: hypothetical protein WC989_01165 [Micavibrio sp.]